MNEALATTDKNEAALATIGAIQLRREFEQLATRVLQGKVTACDMHAMHESLTAHIDQCGELL